MKNRFFIIFLLFITQSYLYGQSEFTQTFDYNAELHRSVKIPNSPEAEAFIKYGNTSVNLYTGTPNISIPIHEYKGKELNLPISLTYDASGVKVEQLANMVGLSWNLNVGGRISRITNGAPDDYLISLTSPYNTVFNDDVRTGMLQYMDENFWFPTRAAVVEYFIFLEKINKGQYDTQPDYFSLNVLGINDYIVFGLENLEPRALNNPRIKVEADIDDYSSGAGKIINGWTIILENGTKCFFEKAETTRYEGNDEGAGFTYGGIKEYKSSWVLTKLISPNGRDFYDFNYNEASDYWTQNISISGLSNTTNVINENTPTNNPTPGTEFGFIPTYKIKQQFLQSITHRFAGHQKTIFDFEYQPRQDIATSKALKKIRILSDQDTIRQYRFNYTYFGNNSRLKLDRLDILNGNDDLYQHYLFDYESPHLVPSLTSKGQDYLGFNNGKTNNTVSYPSVSFAGLSFDGADRDPDHSKAIYGMLNKITYPTGGHTIFEYEPHTTPANQEDISENQVIVTKGALVNFVGGDQNIPCTDEDALCGCDDGWCHDNYGETQPFNQSIVFDIEEAGNYDLTYLEDRDESIAGGGFDMTTLLFKINDLVGSNCNSQSIIPIDQVIDLDLSGSLLIDNSSLIFEDNYLNNTDINGVQSVYLTPGCYQITMINPNPQITLSLIVRGVETTIDTPTEENDQDRAGFRIKEITDYSKENEIAQTKKYVYRIKNSTNVQSSGVVLFDPIFYYFTDGLVTEEDGWYCNINEVMYLHRSGTSSGGERPHVAYTRVYEMLIDHVDDSNNGYTQHDFYAENSGLWSSGQAPNPNNYRPNFRAGKASKTINYNANGKIVASDSTTYTQPILGSYFSSKGIYLVNKPERQYSMLVSRPYDGGYTYDFEPWIYAASDIGSNGGGQPACGWTIPLVVENQNNNIEGHAPNHVYNFDMRTSAAFGREGHVVNKTSTEYFPESQNDETVNSITNTEDFIYDQDNNLLKEIRKTDSKGKQMLIKYEYPHDFESNTVLQDMADDNQLNTPIKTTTIYNRKTNVIEKTYAHIGPGFYVTNIKTSKNSFVVNNNSISTTNNPLEERAYFEYDNFGNVISSYQFKDSNTLEPISPSTYLWGYNYQYPIAKIDNADFSDIIGLISGGMSSLQNLGEQELRDTINAIRQVLPQALVTTYTYDPLIGLTSITDPQGNTVYYEYDDHHRLKYVKDKDGNILSKNDYNYRTQN